MKLKSNWRFCAAFCSPSSEPLTKADMQTYDRPTPETAAFMLQIDDSEIDLGQVEGKLQQFECERDYAREKLAALPEKIVKALDGCYCRRVDHVQGNCHCDEMAALIRQISSENVKEHAPLSARARVDHRDEV
jgi:hypothetical protein